HRAQPGDGVGAHPPGVDGSSWTLAPPGQAIGARGLHAYFSACGRPCVSAHIHRLPAILSEEFNTVLPARIAAQATFSSPPDSNALRELTPVLRPVGSKLTRWKM